MNVEPRPIALIGLSGAGKSAVARVLGERLGCVVADLDAEIEAAAGEPVSALFARHGEPWFRAHEREALARAVDHAGVIACGGGVVTTAESRRLLRERCRVAWLEVEVAEAAHRLGPELATRPLLGGGAAKERLEALLAERAPHYADLAHVRVSSTRRTPEQVATAVLAELERAA